MTGFRRSTNSVRANRLRAARGHIASHVRHLRSSDLGVSLLSNMRTPRIGLPRALRALALRVCRGGFVRDPGLLRRPHTTAPAIGTAGPQPFQRRSVRSSYGTRRGWVSGSVPPSSVARYARKSSGTARPPLAHVPLVRRSSTPAGSLCCAPPAGRSGGTAVPRSAAADPLTAPSCTAPPTPAGTSRPRAPARPAGGPRRPPSAPPHRLELARRADAPDSGQQSPRSAAEG